MQPTPRPTHLTAGPRALWWMGVFAACTTAGCQREALRGEGPVWTDTAEAFEGVALEVAVVDGRGDPLPDAWVSVQEQGRDGQADGAGLVTVDRLRTGPATVVVGLSGYEPVERLIDLGPEGAAAAVQLFPIEPDATLSVTVTDAYGEPLLNAPVLLDGQTIGLTNAEGLLRVDVVEPGTYELRVDAPVGTTWHAWRSPALQIVPEGFAEVDVQLGGQPPATAYYTGTEPCSICHAGAYERWEGSVHAQASRTPDEMVGDPTGIDDDFTGGTVISLGPAVPGAQVELLTQGGSWKVEITDAFGVSTGRLDVMEIYGGHSHGAAVSVMTGPVRSLVPAAWAAASEGSAPGKPGKGWVAAWTDGWFDEQGNLALDIVGRPGLEANFDLNCAGCHATGHAMTNTFNPALEAEGLGSELERVVGCEACHGPGSAHRIAPSSTRRASILQPGRLTGAEQVDVCARCHERVEPDDHPFAIPPAWPMDADGIFPRPGTELYAVATPDPSWWLDYEASRIVGDQAGEHKQGPHHRGPNGYDGACTDCHLVHSTSLRTDLYDNGLCLGCHSTRFPTNSSQASHAGHATFLPGELTPGACVSCHMARSAIVVRPDVLSGAGEARMHQMWPQPPEASLAEFDAAGVTQLPLGQAPISACLDCHRQADATFGCLCPNGDPTQRHVHENMQLSWDKLFGEVP